MQLSARALLCSTCIRKLPVVKVSIALQNIARAILLEQEFAFFAELDLFFPSSPLSHLTGTRHAAISGENRCKNCIS